MPCTLRDAYPLKAASSPGAPAHLILQVDHEGAARSGTLSGQLRDAGRVVAEGRTSVRLEPGSNELDVAIDVPAGAGRGYEVILELDLADERIAGRTALLAIDSWLQAPRYGFLSEFAPEASQGERVRDLAKFHVTVVQFYDWMYRHYRFLPPSDAFVDAMGRTLSLRTVGERVASCHRHGMAALAYGAVYGAETEFVRDRPEWILKDAAGADLSLIDLFTINDLRPGSLWREHILREFEGCVEHVGFDGIHMDQYGFPKWAYDASGASVDLATIFPGLIDEAASRVSAVREGAAVLFNAVNNWPIEEVATSDQVAVYIEVWPPHERYQDLVDLIRRARDLSGKHAILAAYLEPFREGGAGAEASALLATAVIAAAGGHHLLLGEGDGVLRDPYYPNHGRLEASFVPHLRRYYDHTAAFHHYLAAQDLRDVTSSFTTGINNEITLVGAPNGARPVADGIWITVRQRRNRLVINLVNLIGVGDDRWNVAKEQPLPRDGLAVRFSPFARVDRVVWASPDDDGPAHALEIEVGSDGVTVVDLPRLALWATLIVDLDG
jgi:dextranase